MHCDDHSRCLSDCRFRPLPSSVRGWLISVLLGTMNISAMLILHTEFVLFSSFVTLLSAYYLVYSNNFLALIKPEKVTFFWRLS
jgi:hypothetical protein